MEERKSSHLKLVKLEDKEPATGLTCSRTDLIQADLFPMAKPGLLIFSDASELSADRFLTLLNEARPTFVLDVRPTPRFDMGRLNRRQVFEIFRENHIHYVDVAGLVGVSSSRDANLNPAFLIGTINASLQCRGTSTVEGPILILCDNEEFLHSAMEVFPKLLLKNEKQQWDVCLASLSSPSVTHQI